MGAGYLLVDPLIGFGDWGAFIEDLEPAIAWRLGLTVLGAASFAGSIWWLARSVRRFTGDGPGSRRRGRQLALLPYLIVGGGLLTGAALLNSKGPATR